MKKIILIFICGMIIPMFNFACTSHNVFKQPSLETNRREKETKEISYITSCLKEGRSIDSLIEWKNHGDNEELISYEHKERLVFFKVVKGTSNEVD